VQVLKHRILIAEDHSLLREGLRSMIAAIPNFEVVGEARDGKEAVQMALHLQPDVIMMDLSMPSMSGIEATVQIKRRNPQIKIIALTVYKSAEYVQEALKAGVDGYVLKDSTYTELVTAIQSVLDGKKFLSPDVAGQVVNRYLTGVPVDKTTSLWDKLTTRERSIVKLVAEGRTNRAAAEYLNVSPKTIEKHRASLMQKLGLKNATDLVLLALQQGWVEPEHMANGHNQSSFSDSELAFDGPAESKMRRATDVQRKPLPVFEKRRASDSVPNGFLDTEPFSEAKFNRA
jgi:DNA-binding NarL/FixJ family response regulator